MPFQNKNVQNSNCDGVNQLKQDKIHKQSGRSMVEMLGVLAIVAVLSVGAIAGYNLVAQTQKTQTLMQKIYFLSAQARTVCNGDCTGLTNNVLKNTGRIKASDLDNPFGGTIEVGKSGKCLGCFYIQANSLPMEACVDMLTNDWGGPNVLLGSYMRNPSSPTTVCTGTSCPAKQNTAVTSCQSQTGDTKYVGMWFK